jgi:hypothetical protein
LEPDRLQHDVSATCVIAQQYCTAPFPLTALSFPQGNDSERIFKNAAILFLFYLF